MIVTRFCIVFLTLTQSLLCMENSNHNSNIMNSNTLSDRIKHDLGLFNHDTICSLALVNKGLNKSVEESTINRELFLKYQTIFYELSKNNPTLDQQIKWHKYKSAYAYWTSKNAWIDEREEKQITFNLVYLNGSNTIYHDQLECHSTDLCAPNRNIYAENYPFFNSKGEACFHAQGQFNLQKGAEGGALFCPSFRSYIFKYSINTNGLKKQLPCYVRMDKETSRKAVINLINFENNPILLQKILNSKSIT